MKNAGFYDIISDLQIFNFKRKRYLMKRRIIISLIMTHILFLSACGMNNNDESEFDQQQTINDTNYQESNGSGNND